MSSAYPEPTDVGPAVGGHLRASDSDREQVATLLSAAYAEGRLSRDEHDERLNAAMEARTFDDLVPLTRDLVNLDGPVGVASQGHVPVLDESEANPDTDVIVTIFSGTDRKGQWRVRRHISAMTVFGGTDLDMTEAIFEADICTINVFCMFGGMDIKVPRGVGVRNEAIAIFGGIGLGKGVSAPEPGKPTVVVKGFVGFGGVDVKLPKRDREQES